MHSMSPNPQTTDTADSGNQEFVALAFRNRTVVVKSASWYIFRIFYPSVLFGVWRLTQLYRIAMTIDARRFEKVLSIDTTYANRELYGLTW